MSNQFSQEVKKMYNRLVNTVEKFKFEGITVLTGTNGSGKSVIRKQLPLMLSQYDNINKSEVKGRILSTSMDLRTQSNPERGALSGMMNDTGWIATSQNTFNNIKQLLNVVKSKEDKATYIVIDEFEIGCGEETILAIILYINERLEYLMKNTNIEGALIITHSRIGVENLKHDRFLNLEEMTKEEWLNREIIPTNLEKLNKNELFSYIKFMQKT